MLRLLLQNEVRLRAECTLREQVAENVTFLRQLVDTLTNVSLAFSIEYFFVQVLFVTELAVTVSYQ